MSKVDGRAGGYINRDRSWHPPAFTPDYKSSVTRSPNQPLLSLPTSISEETGPVFGQGLIGDLDNDLVLNFGTAGEMAIGPRIILHGRVMDEYGRGVPGALVEIWQANAGGRYRHSKETYIAPLDPNFGGCGRTITADDGSYVFRTVRPGPYPWPNTMNDWRPCHVHFSLFGAAFAQRLITQMYFEGDPLIAHCPMANGIPSDEARSRLVAPLDMNGTIPMDSLAYKFDLVLRGRRQTPFENRKDGL